MASDLLQSGHYAAFWPLRARFLIRWDGGYAVRTGFFSSESPKTAYYP